MFLPKYGIMSAMDRWSAMQSFVRVVESGSFVAAAERLGLSTSSLSRQIAELEQHLGARLLNRTTRRLSLTESGQAFYERAVSLLNDLAEAEALAGQAAAKPRGTLRLTCPHNMAERRIAPAIASFVERYPDVKFDLTVTDRTIDLIDEGLDLAIRVGDVGSDRLVARRLGQTELIMCAAPAYLGRRGAPATPSDLATHNALTYAYSPRSWRLRGSRRRTSTKCASREACMRTTAMCSARQPLLGWASSAHPISWLATRLPPARSSACCQRSRRCEPTSGRSIQASATCR